MYCLIVITVFMSEIVHGFKSSIYKNMHSSRIVYPELKKLNRASTLRVVEHLIDCETNKAIAGLFNDNEYCLNSGDGIFTDIKGFLEQVANIGYLVIAYYLIKRSNNGIKEWNIDSNEDESVNGSNSFDFINSNSNSNRCPLCNGSGIFTSQTLERGTCELCQGVGTIPKVKPYDLPTRSSSVKSLNIDEADDDN